MIKRSDKAAKSFTLSNKITELVQTWEFSQWFETDPRHWSKSNLLNNIYSFWSRQNLWIILEKIGSCPASIFRLMLISYQFALSNCIRSFFSSNNRLLTYLYMPFYKYTHLYINGYTYINAFHGKVSVHFSHQWVLVVQCFVGGCQLFSLQTSAHSYSEWFNSPWHMLFRFENAMTFSSGRNNLTFSKVTQIFFL